MALIVEDGTALVNADAYVSVADADTYHAAFGNAAWAAATTNDKEVAIRKATAEMDRRYYSRWLGVKTTEEQALDWPRSDVFTRDGFRIERNSMPRELPRACAELALSALTDDLSPNLTTDDGAVTQESVAVGPISISQSFQGAKVTSTYYRKVEQLVGRLTSSGSEAVRA